MKMPKFLIFIVDMDYNKLKIYDKETSYRINYQ